MAETFSNGEKLSSVRSKLNASIVQAEDAEAVAVAAAQKADVNAAAIANLGDLADKDKAAWDTDITGIPDTFPPDAHTHEILDVVGLNAALTSKIEAANLSYDAVTRTIASDAGTDAVLPVMTPTVSGLTPVSSGAVGDFLRADGVWAPPPLAGGGVALTDGDKGDVVVSGTGTIWVVDPTTVMTLADVQTVAGVKTFTSGVTISNAAPSISFSETGATPKTWKALVDGDVFQIKNDADLSVVSVDGTGKMTLTSTSPLLILNDTNGPDGGVTPGPTVIFQNNGVLAGAVGCYTTSLGGISLRNFTGNVTIVSDSDNVSPNSRVVFTIDGANAGFVETPAAGLPDVLSLVTRAAGDARYALGVGDAVLLTGPQTINGTKTFTTRPTLEAGFTAMTPSMGGISARTHPSGAYFDFYGLDGAGASSGPHYRMYADGTLAQPAGIVTRGLGDLRYAQLAATNTFTLNPTVENSAPRLYLSDTSETGKWSLRVDGGQLQFRNNDDLTLAYFLASGRLVTTFGIEMPHTVTLSVVPFVTSTATDFGVRLFGDDTAKAGKIILKHSSASATTEVVFQSRRNVTDNFLIYANGDVKNVTGVIGTISDAALKQDIVDIGPQLEELRQLRVRHYRLKEEVAEAAALGLPEAHLHAGLIAQEVQPIKPGLVFAPDENGMLGVKTSILIPLLLKAVQELADKVDALQAQLNPA